MSSLLNDLRAVWMHFPNVVATEEDDAAYDRLEAFIKANTPWYPPVPEGFGPWIEYKPGDKGPHVNDMVSWLLIGERDRQNHAYRPAPAHDLSWGEHIVAYCVKLEGGK